MKSTELISEGGIPTSPRPPHNPQRVKMMNSMMIGNTEIKMKDGLYCLNDLHVASGGKSKDRPKTWLENNQAKALVRAAESEGGIPATLKVVRGGLAKDQGTYACKELVYGYAMWISPEFSIHVIRAYDAMVTGTKPEPTDKEAEAIVRAMGTDIQKVWSQIAELEAEIPEILEATAQKLRGSVH